MKWYNALWIGPNAAKKKSKIISSVERREHVPGIWLITLAENPAEALDIIPTNILTNKFYLSYDFYILGIASGKQEAFELVEKMVDYIYRETGTLDIRDYFSD